MSTVMTEDRHRWTASMIDEELTADDEDRGVGPAPECVVPPSRVRRVGRSPPAISTPHGRSRVLPRLLAMADTYYHGGSLRQAIELYFELVRDHADTPQAHQAEERLLDVARTTSRPANCGRRGGSMSSSSETEPLDSDEPAPRARRLRGGSRSARPSTACSTRASSWPARS